MLERLANMIRPSEHGANGSALVPVGVADYLTYDNPRLKQRYLGHPATQHSLWSESYLKRELKLLSFRGDNAYVYQGRYACEAAYALTTHYILAQDSLQLLKKLKDDELFGNHVVNFDDRLWVSRDLLDSVLEINFLNRELGLQARHNLNILDIGAGYGRLAHRLVEALPNIEHVLCTDAIAESTFLSEFYLRFREVDRKARAVPLDQIEGTLAKHPVDLAVNIHSFGECTFSSIVWWLNLLEANMVKYLFIVANADGLGSTEADKTNVDYLPAILERGYRLRTRQPKFVDPSVQRHGLYPTYYFLFERA